jgi:hypothetical protein
MRESDLELCRNALERLVANEPELVVLMLDEWTAQAQAEGDAGTVDALLDLRPEVAPGK